MDTTDLTRRLTALTRDLILIPSTESRPEDRRRCLSFIHNHLEALPGFRVDVYECQGYQSLVAMPEGIQEPAVLLCAHLDVIDHPDASVFQSVVEDGCIRGPGAGDMKGQLAICMELLREFSERTPLPSVGLAVTSDEERGGEHGVRYLFQDAGLRCGTAIIPDGGAIDRITVEEKGILHLHFSVEGPSGHAARPWLAANPLDRLMAALTRLNEYFDALAGPIEPDSPEHWWPTFTVTRVGTENTTFNRIPGDGFASADVRFVPPDTAASMLEKIRNLTGPGIEVVPLISAEPTHLAPDPLFVEITESVTGRPARLSRVSGGSDARFICAFGIPTLLSRPDVGNLHGEDEWIGIDSMAIYYRICRDYILKKLGLEPRPDSGTGT